MFYQSILCCTANTKFFLCNFSVFLEYSRGVQLFVGSANNDPATKIGLHCGDNVFDESALSVGVSVLTQYVLDALGA